MIRYDTIEEFNVDSKSEYTAESGTRSQKLKQTNSARFPQTVQINPNNVSVVNWPVKIHTYLIWQQLKNSVHCIHFGRSV